MGHSLHVDGSPAGVHRHHQPYMPVFAWVWAHRRIPAEYDVILSNKSAFCIAARGLHPSVRHVCYCLTPTRFVYDFTAYAKRERIPPGASAILHVLNHYLRRWETRVAQHVTAFIAISREVQQRIRKYYGRESVVIYPPVEMPPYLPDIQDQGFYLIVSRLLPYKRIDMAIEAFGRLGLPLIVAGDGRDRPRLERLAARQPGSNIRLLGRIDDATLRRLLAECRAFIFPGVEDFGIAPIRAMAYGKPVIAYAGGGALDYVANGVTGTLFYPQTPDALAEAVLRHSGVAFAPAEIRRHAEQFSVERFEHEITDFLRRLGLG